MAWNKLFFLPTFASNNSYDCVRSFPRSGASERELLMWFVGRMLLGKVRKEARMGGQKQLS